MKKIIYFFLPFLIIGCGTTNSLEKTNSVPYAIVNVSDTLKVTGRLLEENDSRLLVAVDGVSKEYLKSKIKNYEIVMLPDERLMMEDIVKNTSKAASNTDFFVIVSIISIIAAISSASK